MKIKKKKGITLVELIVTSGIVVILTLVVTVIMVRSISAYRLSNKSVSLQEDAAKVMREFEYSARAASEIVTADSDEFTYLRYFDLVSSSPSQVRFFVDGNQLKMGRVEPVGVEPSVSYPPENEAVTLLVENLINPTEVFYYYDDNSALLSEPIAESGIRMAEIVVTLDDDPSNTPEAVTEQTKVQFRNLKTNL